MKRTPAPISQTRRDFFHHTALAGAAMAAPWALNLAAFADAAAQSSSESDYKALVCVYLQGGNDQANTVVHYDDIRHPIYVAKRNGVRIPIKDSASNPTGTYEGGFAIPQADLTNTLLVPETQLADSMQFALAPELAPLKNLFDTKKLAVLMNVGTLKVPTSKQAYIDKNVPLPPKLFSHNDQLNLWLSGEPEGADKGWGGKLEEAVQGAPASGLDFRCITVTGNSLYLAGNTTIPYKIEVDGAFPITALSQAGFYDSPVCSAALLDIIQTTTEPVHALNQAYVKVTQRAIAAQGIVTTAITPPANDPLSDWNAGAGSNLEQQLKMVARLIAGRGHLGSPSRQVFMVGIGGFDLHDHMNEMHGKLLTQVGQALSAFYDATQRLGLQNQITTFTVSEFGRAMQVNGDGSDHGWGSHHFILGGAVKGKNIYGVPPDIKLNAADNPVDIGQGRLLPTTSVDQYAATLAKWFGVPDDGLAAIAPNLGTTPSPLLSFL